MKRFIFALTLSLFSNLVQAQEVVPPGLTPGQILGTATNDSASAGNIGERLAATTESGSAISLTTTVAANINAGITLTPGDWDVSAQAHFNPANTTSVNRFIFSISTTSATLDTTAARFVQNGISYTSTGNSHSVSIAPTRISVNANTTVFPVISATFTVSTATAHGLIRAVRVR